jgi:hypothetical protein
MGTPWQQTGKTTSQRDTDLRVCEQRAETDTLADRGTSRADYDLATRGPNATMDPRGLRPLELKDRSDMANQFDTLVGRCMKSKGYVQGKSANTPRR